MSLQEKLLAAFDIEHRTVLEKIRASLAFVESSEGQSSDPKTSLEEAFRMAHSLKGAARVVDFKTVMNLAHHLETLFALIRQGQVLLSPELISLFYQVLDEVEDSVQALRGGQEFVQNNELSVALEKAIAQANVKSDIPLAGSVPVGLKTLESASSKGPTQNNVQALPLKAESLRVNTAHLDRMLKTAGTLATTALSTQNMAPAHISIDRKVRDLDREWMRVRMSSGKILRQRATDPEVMRLVSFFEYAEQELKSLVREVSSLKRRQQRNNRQLIQVGMQLESDIQNARLVPVESVFDGFNKMLRDLAAEHGKKVEFRAIGLSQDADRYVLQELKDPLMHLLRNTIAHGLETPEERIAASKNPVGRVTLKLESDSGKLNFILEDDGRGLDLARIRKIAVKQGLATLEQLSSFTDAQLHDLIFEPGFSTSEQVDDLSGRGMGLSVVQEAIRRLQGSLALSSEVGKGCVFRLSVPVIIALHRVLLVQSNSKVYAILCQNVRTLARLSVKEIQNVNGVPAFFHQGELVAIYSLAETLQGRTETSAPYNSQYLKMIIADCSGRRIGLIVDEFVGERQAVIKNMPTPELGSLPSVRGAIALEDGSVCLVLNVDALIKNPSGRLMQAIESVASAESAVAETDELNSAIAAPPGRKRILVVDDSFTTRTLEKSILEANGFEVTLAVDGVEALQKLQVHDFDLMISDVEMPRMNGFELLEEVKNNGRLKKLPVIMVTSLESPKDQERGLELGADAYIAKQKFDQGKLLEIVRQIL